MNFRKSLPYLLLGLGSAAYLYPFLRVVSMIGDEGTFLYGAQRVTEGAVPGRDFFEAMAPGSFYWLALFFRLFGTTWMVSRIVMAATGVAITVTVFWLARRLHSRFDTLAPIVLLVTTIPIWTATSHHLTSNLFALVSFAALLGWMDTGRRWCLYTAGALAGITTVFMQQKGLFLFFSYLLIVWIVGRKREGWLRDCAKVAAGYAAFLVVVACYFYSVGALWDVTYANLVWPFTNYSTVNRVPYAYGLREVYFRWWVGIFSNWFPYAVASSIVGALLFPLFLIAAVPVLLLAVAAFHRKIAFTPSAVPYWMAGMALWASEMHRKDIAHLVFGSPILLVLCFYLLEQTRSRWWRWGSAALTVSFCLLAAFQLVGTRTAETRIATRRGVVYESANDGALRFLEDRARPREAIFVYPYCPMYYFLSGTENATRYSILMYHINTNAQFHEVIFALEQKQVRYVLWDTVMEGRNLRRWFPGYQHPPAEQQVVEPYLKEHYTVVGIENGVRLLERKDTIADARTIAASSASRNLRALQTR